MVQAVSHRPGAAEARVLHKARGKSTTGTSLSPGTSAFPCPFHSTNDPYSSIHSSIIDTENTKYSNNTVLSLKTINICHCVKLCKEINFKKISSLLYEQSNVELERWRGKTENHNFKSYCLLRGLTPIKSGKIAN